MSEQALPFAQFNFTVEDVVRFLQEKWKLSSCEICLEQNTYGLNAYQSENPIIIALPLNRSGEVLTTVPASLQACINLFCANCGNVKLLSANVVGTWLDQNK